MTLQEFINLSAALTGYAVSTINPSPDTQRMAEELYPELSKPENNIPPAQLAALTQKWNSIANTPPAQLEDKVRTEIIEDLSITRLAQNIIYLWYLGIWYDLSKNPNDFTANNHVVSSKAYTNGMVWGEMGAHPMGFSTDVFGYWSNVPTVPELH